MIRKGLLTTAVAVMGLGLAVEAQGTLQITVPDVQLLPNQAGQVITLEVIGGDEVAGLNLYAQIGENETAQPTPIFQGVDFSIGMWQGKDTTIIGGPVAEAPRYLFVSVVLNGFMETTPAAGQIAQITVSTEGIDEGVFPLKLAGTDIGQDAAFIAAGGAGIPIDIVNGTITVAVPEPSCLGLLGLAGWGLMRRRARLMHL